MNAKQKYIRALQDLIDAHRELQKEQFETENENPFDMGMPENTFSPHLFCIK